MSNDDKSLETKKPEKLIKKISKLENEIKNAENYKILYDQAPLPYHSLNEKGIILDVNPAWLNALGYTKKEAIGTRIKDLIHPDWGKDYDKKFPMFKKQGYVKNAEFRLLKKNGEYIDIKLDGRIGHNPDGSFKQTYCVFRDVTEQKQIERELKESEDRYRKLSQASFEGVVISEKGIVIEANKQICEMLKISKNKLIGMKASDFVAPESLDIVKQHMESGSEKPYEHIAMRSDGSKFPVEVRARTIKTESVNLRVTTIRDITERKNREAELQEHKDNLEDLVKNRTKELEERTEQLDTSVKVFVGREQKIIRLEDKIKKLETLLKSKNN